MNGATSTTYLIEITEVKGYGERREDGAENTNTGTKAGEGVGGDEKTKFFVFGNRDFWVQRLRNTHQSDPTWRNVISRDTTPTTRGGLLSRYRQSNGYRGHPDC